MSDASADFLHALDVLQRYGLLLASDARLPSVASLVAGEPVRGSWWGRPRADVIFGITEELAAHPDVLVTKLISAKVTYVHRNLWSAFAGVAFAREPWQLEDLSSTAVSLLNLVTTEGDVQTDVVLLTGGTRIKRPGEAVRELEKRLLLHSEEVHTATGAHAKHLETWERWVHRVGFSRRARTPAQGKHELEGLLQDLNQQFEANGRLPWK